MSIILFVFMIPGGFESLAQPKLKILYTRFGYLKKYELYPNDPLEYKLKGDHHFTAARIIALRDSTVILTTDSVNISQFKSIRIHKNNYHVKLFHKIFLYAGVGFPALNLFNNSMNHVSPLINEKAAIITGSFLAASFILYRLNIKKIRLSKNKTIKIVDIDFEHL